MARLNSYDLGCDASASLKYHTNLSHLNMQGYYQFITYRTHDSIDSYLNKLTSSQNKESHKQQLVDDYLDSSKNGAYLNDEVLTYLYNFLKSMDTKIYELSSFAIMPNHIHLLCKPTVELSVLIQKLKGVTSKEINSILNKKGKFWASEYYDKAIRDEKHFDVVYEYIKNNPLKLRDEAKASFPRWYSRYE